MAESRLALRNARTGLDLATDLRIARSFWRKGAGLLGEASLPAGCGLYIESCNSIHSFFMRFVFDAVFVDRQWQVVYLVREMRPYRVSRIVWKAHGVVELPAGTVAATGTAIGDRLELLGP